MDGLGTRLAHRRQPTKHQRFRVFAIGEAEGTHLPRKET